MSERNLLVIYIMCIIALTVIALRRPEEAEMIETSCPKHPSSTLEWDGHDMVCGPCSLGVEVEDCDLEHYEKVHILVTQAMAVQHSATTHGTPHNTSDQAEKITRDILKIF